MFDLQTKDLKLPDNWTFHAIGQSVTNHSSNWRASPAEAPEVWIGCYSMYRQQSASAVKTIKAMLDAPAHDLTEEEIESTLLFRECFPYEANESPQKAYTTDWASYRAVIFERHWSYYDNKRTYEMIVDPKADGSYCFHFFYAAPEAQFDRFWTLAKDWMATQAIQLVERYRAR